MASWWTVVLILHIGALWEYTGATSCTDLTKKTCTPTLQVTGTCTNSVCDCKSGLVSIRTGCSGVVKPTIGVFPATPTSFETKSIGSGEVLKGKDIKLVCSPDYGDGFYVWTKDGVKVDGQANSVFTLTTTTLDKSGSYKCQVKIPTLDFETTISEAVAISVIDDTSGTFVIRPKVVGMPARAFSGAQLNLECVNIPSGLTLTYVWNDGADISGQSGQTLSITVPATSKAYTCKYTTTLGTVTVPAASAAVNSPAADATTITGVYLSSNDPSAIPADGPRYDLPPTVYAEVGKQLKMYCAINDTDLILPSSAITYAWKKGADPLTGTTNTFTIASPSESNEGSYTCTATVSGKPYTSKPVQLNIETKVIDSVTIVVTPTIPVIGGYVILDCKVKTADLRLATYSWKKGSKTLWNVTDRVLQINDLKAADNVAYDCTATVGLDSDSDSETLAAVDLSTIAPVVTSNVVGSLYGLGNKYTLTCGEDYTIPGLTYKWYEGDTEVTGQTAKNYEITVKAGTTVYKCQIILGSITSLKSSTGLSVESKQLLSADINVGSLSVPDPYKPVTDSSVTLTCIASLATGASGTPTYAWTKGTVSPTNVGLASTYTFKAGSGTDDTYTCTVILGGETKTDAVVVTSSATIQTPTISTRADTYGSSAVESYSEGGNYDLTCNTDSYNTDLTYVWKKDGNIVGTSRVYQITNANKVSSAGSYVCTVLRGDLSSSGSTAKSITIGEKGKPCQYSVECDGDQYDDVCLSNRCVCASGYTPKGNTCSGQGIVTISMLLFVLCGVIKLIM